MRGDKKMIKERKREQRNGTKGKAITKESTEKEKGGDEEKRAKRRKKTKEEEREEERGEA